MYAVNAINAVMGDLGRLWRKEESKNGAPTTAGTLNERRARAQ